MRDLSVLITVRACLPRRQRLAQRFSLAWVAWIVGHRDSHSSGFRPAQHFDCPPLALYALRRIFNDVSDPSQTLLGSSTHKKVPPENSNSTPVHHLINAGSALPPPPSARTMSHVPTAPAGAARLKITRCALAPRLPKPCLSNTDVSPNAAGALCTMIATNMIRDNEVVDVEDEDAPSAIPSAAAWMQRPSVVERDRWGEAGVGGGDVERSERE